MVEEKKTTDVIPEKELEPRAGWGPLALLALGLLVGTPLLIILGAIAADAVNPAFGLLILVGLLLGLACLIGLFGCMIVNPNEARVLVLFGTYHGTVKKAGFYYVNPFFSKRKLSLRVRTFETGYSVTGEKKDSAGHVLQAASRVRQPAKVNDRDGNPIEIAAVVVWKVVDTAEAVFRVDNYEEYVQVQSEAALRNLASHYPYDSDDDKVVSLRGHTAAVGDQLKTELQERLAQAGVEVLESRISYLAYAPEIAAAMLQRQQAAAIIAARQKIVEGAVGMVEMALDRLSKQKVVELDEVRKAAMVSNLLVVLCGERSTQPVIQTGQSAS
jgi:regulator of protease activity HflC (stomatin/prohibitin superfamily)